MKGPGGSGKSGSGDRNITSGSCLNSRFTAAIGVGTPFVANVPSPNCPATLYPQQNPLPLSAIAHVCCPPTVTYLNRSVLRIRLARALADPGAPGPRPNCPSLFKPQHHTCCDKSMP